MFKENSQWELINKIWVPKHRKRTGFEDKTLWDWLQFIAIITIPLMVAFASILFGLQQAYLAQQQHDSDQKIANQQHDSDQKIANQQYQENLTYAQEQQESAILQTYLDKIQDLLLNHNLLRSKPDNDVATLARARTLTALRGLDPESKGALLQFLHDTNLINGGNEIIDLRNADLSNADLSNANLSNVDLSNTNLSNAILFQTNLSNANLRKANLSSSNLGSSNLSDSNLSHADLIAAILSGANVSDTDLSGANLNEANLSDTTLSKEQLAQIYSMKNAIMPDGSIHR